MTENFDRLMETRGRGASKGHKANEGSLKEPYKARAGRTHTLTIAMRLAGPTEEAVKRTARFAKGFPRRFNVRQPRTWGTAQYAEDPLLQLAVERGYSSISYKTYLRTQWWLQRRELALIADHRICSMCGSHEHLQVHHLTYLNLWMEQEMDLTVLCDSCHRAETGRLSSNPNPGRRNYAPKNVKIPPTVYALIVRNTAE